MEEGGGATCQEINSRLKQWNNSKKPTLLDNYEFHSTITNDTGKSFDFLFKGKKSKYQRTWGGLIKILLNYKFDDEIKLNDVKDFQSSQLGRYKSNNCLMEVFPLPSPNSSVFYYSKWTDNYLKSRTQYKEDIKDLRIRTLNQLIENHKPKFVIFYSSASEYSDYWSKISGIDFNTINPIEIEKKKKKTLKVKIGKNNSTTFAVVHHPVFPGITNNYLKKVGKEIKSTVQYGI